MSLFGDDDDVPSRPKPSPSLFDDDPKPANRAAGNSLFADDGFADDSPWGFPTPKKAARGSLVKTLLPPSEAPESYHAAYDALLEGKEGEEVRASAVRKLLKECGLEDSVQARIAEIVSLPNQDGASVGRSEFNVLFALIGLAQEGDDVTLDSVDERKRNLPVPSTSLSLKPEAHESPRAVTPAAEPTPEPHSMPPPTPPQEQHQHQQKKEQQPPPQTPTTPGRSHGALRKQSFGDPEADPWASPELHRGHSHGSYTAVPPRVNGMHGTSENRTTSGFTTTSQATASSTVADSAHQRPSTLGSEGGWAAFNGAPGEPFAGAGLEAGGFGTSPGGPSHPPASGRAIGGGPVLPHGPEETVTVTTIAEKEGMFMFQHRNYEVTSARRNSKVIRRYSDFVWLLDCLHKRYPFRQLPLLPPKRVAINGNYLAADASFVEKRRRGLARFVNALVRHPVLSQEQLVVMFLTVPTELAVWRKQATISVTEEFTNKPLPPTLEDSLPPTLPTLFDTVRTGIRKQADIYINLCNMMERLCKRNEGFANEYLRFSSALHLLTETSHEAYAVDTADVDALNRGLLASARHLETGKQLLEDESRGWEEGVLEDLKRMRDGVVGMRDLFDRRDKFAKDNIPQLEKRIAGNENKLQVIRGKAEVKPGEAEKVEEAILRDKQSIVQQHARGVFIKECIRDELLYWNQSQYYVGRLHQDWAQERVKYAELGADNWRAWSEEVEGMPTGE
ncbi:hypothetical protein M011DRAFT_451663 [Sporormia fimetaria CBS 119925]|uniref:Sorting nexin MVP1 n=1 Tax=Sporormia fimetaria CBS 119925 TaxID=1340428 RepID=A0A6A6UYE9_9PLEO|nr:hypothetical protein M011DRAFT_451663 [Sporormia fimetaria CBS 119925]